jgi:hypothetical protein
MAFLFLLLSEFKISVFHVVYYCDTVGTTHGQDIELQWILRNRFRDSKMKLPSLLIHNFLDTSLIPRNMNSFPTVIDKPQIYLKL